MFFKKYPLGFRFQKDLNFILFVFLPFSTVLLHCLPKTCDSLRPVIEKEKEAEEEGKEILH